MLKNVVPVCISLKHILENIRSPLLRHLLAYLQFLFHHYPSDMQDLLANNRLLARELEYDMEKIKEQQGGRRQAIHLLSSTDLSASPAPRLMRPPFEDEAEEEDGGECLLGTPPPMPMQLTPGSSRQGRGSSRTPLEAGSSPRGMRRPLVSSSSKRSAASCTPHVLPRVARRSPLKVHF